MLWILTSTHDLSLSAEECFGLHIGDPQTANLGDGQGSVDELVRCSSQDSELKHS